MKIVVYIQSIDVFFIKKKTQKININVELPSCITRENICWDADRHTVGAYSIVEGVAQ